MWLAPWWQLPLPNNTKKKLQGQKEHDEEKDQGNGDHEQHHNYEEDQVGEQHILKEVWRSSKQAEC